MGYTQPSSKGGSKVKIKVGSPYKVRLGVDKRVGGKLGKIRK